ncbi:penicillin-binding transpeptidase domain-containing protein [Nocardia sp. NPDC048505]|uniref:penicillin-binding transpeptidase domain-containing protein n=1 Tax=Nocardia sp. NPDC048505 TaxID=3155756 RepID=UPI0033CD0D4D
MSSTRLLILPAIIAIAVAAAGCSTGPKGPVQAAEAFVTAFAERDLTRAAKLTSEPEQAAAAMDSAWSQLEAEELTAHTGAVRINGDAGTVDYTYRWRLPKDRVWTYTGQLQLGRSEGRWRVRWTAADIHPKLGDTQTMQFHVTPAPRARVNEQSGSDVLVPGKVSRVTFTAAEAPDPGWVSIVLSSALRRFDWKLTAEAIRDRAQDTEGAYRVADLSEAEFDAVREDLTGLPGVRVTEQWDLLPTDRWFAPDLMSQIRTTVIAEVDGKSGWSVVTRNANGMETDVLTEVPAQPAPSFALSIDRNVQTAAQRAVDARQEQTMMVVLRPSTGAILAVAQNPAADKDGPVATIGAYPPGSVFKTVTAAAAMANGSADPDTVLPCPSRITIGERMIPNYNLFTIGDAPMSAAYERSCNTAFAKLASTLPPDALHDAAAGLGVGPDYTVVGIPTITGTVPPAEGLVQRTEDGIGQGRVLVSPFGMALMAATVARGSVPVPYLIAGRETTIEHAPPPIDPAVVRGLRTMMRKVVTGGTAERIADQGEVYGKTGEAEANGGSHSWFVGYRGDIAFATLLVQGGSSDNAVAVTREMMTALPAGY